MKIKNKRILVTGANGFIGRHLCKTLFNEGANLVGLVRNFERNIFLVKQYEADILNNTAVSKIIHDAQPEIVVHLAANKNRGKDSIAFQEGYENNLIGSINIINACHDIKNFTKFVSLGSTDEYGMLQVPFKESNKEAPNNAYGVSKLAVTDLLRALSRSNRFPSVILRPTIAYGPGQNDSMFLPSLIKALVAGKSFEMSLGNQNRDFIYVDDLVNAIILVLTTPSLRCNVINISSATPIRLKILAKMVAKILGNGTDKLIKFGSKEYRSSDVMDYWSNNMLAKQTLGWYPMVSLEDGLQRTILHFKSEFEIINEKKNTLSF